MKSIYPLILSTFLLSSTLFAGCLLDASPFLTQSEKKENVTLISLEKEMALFRAYGTKLKPIQGHNEILLKIVDRSNSLVKKMQSYLESEGIKTSFVQKIYSITPENKASYLTLQLAIPQHSTQKGFAKLFAYAKAADLTSIEFDPLFAVYMETAGFFQGGVESLISLTPDAISLLMRNEDIDDAMRHELSHAFFFKKNLQNKKHIFHTIWSARVNNPLPISEVGLGNYKYFLSAEELYNYINQPFWILESTPITKITSQQRLILLEQIKRRLNDTAGIINETHDLAIRTLKRLTELYQLEGSDRLQFSINAKGEATAITFKLDDNTNVILPAPELADLLNLSEAKTNLAKKFTEKKDIADIKKYALIRDTYRMIEDRILMREINTQNSLLEVMRGYGKQLPETLEKVDALNLLESEGTPIDPSDVKRKYQELKVEMRNLSNKGRAAFRAQLD